MGFLNLYCVEVQLPHAHLFSVITVSYTYKNEGTQVGRIETSPENNKV